MADDELQVPCPECGEEFNPELSEKKGWTCPNCGTRQPDLALHYRVLAYLCAVGLATILYMLISSLRRPEGFAWGHLLPVTQAALLLITITVLILRDRPWKNAAVRAAVWLVYGSFVLFYFLLPLLIVLLLIRRDIAQYLRVLLPHGVVLVCVGIYVSWIHIVSRRFERTAPPDTL